MLFVIDRETRTKMVAIGFSHREKSTHAFLIYAFATRLDPGLAEPSQVLARTAKRCLHFIAAAYGRPGHLLYDVRGGKRGYAESFGFREASQRREDLDRVGGTLMIQDEPVD